MKALLDAVFGRKNLPGQLVWRRYGSHHDSKNYGRAYDVILDYAKDGKGIWNSVYAALDLAKFKVILRRNRSLKE